MPTVVLEGNLSEGFRVHGPYHDFDTAACGHDDGGWVMTLEVPHDSRAAWDNDLIQFARLLSEIDANVNVDIKSADFQSLCASMDLTPDKVRELMDRAQEVWEEAKARRAQGAHAPRPRRRRT
jgi:hypothetical protein